MCGKVGRFFGSVDMQASPSSCNAALVHIRWPLLPLTRVKFSAWLPPAEATSEASKCADELDIMCWHKKQRPLVTELLPADLTAPHSPIMTSSRHIACKGLVCAASMQLLGALHTACNECRLSGSGRTNLICGRRPWRPRQPRFVLRSGRQA